MLREARELLGLVGLVGLAARPMAQHIRQYGQPTHWWKLWRLAATHPQFDPQSNIPEARITIEDQPGELATLTLAAGDLELSIALAAAECIAIADELIAAARRRMWPA